MVIFAILRLAPGGPLDAYAPPSAPLTHAARLALSKALGLNHPLPIQYLDWVWQAVHGNLGLSAAEDFVPVSTLIATHVGPTLALMGTGVAIGIVLGVGFGVLSAQYQYGVTDFGLTLFGFLGLAMPAFLAGLLGLYVFSIQLGWFPSGGDQTPGQPATVGQFLYHLILPALILSFNQIAGFMRYTRSALLEVRHEDYVLTATAKGASTFRVVMRHELPNALLPVVTMVGASIPNLIGGAVFLETIFDWPGMGQLFVTAVVARDYATIMGMTLVVAIVVLVGNLVTDVAYSAIDPRIRYAK
jgi:peptide/nickel transport system permease protein